MRHSTDYRDYVIRDRKLIGKFNEMYKYSKEIPWHQDKTAYFIFSNIDIAILKHYNYNSVCEIGCGIGYFTERLRKELKAKTAIDKRPRVTGVDISETAISQARSNFPQIRFIVGDLLKERPLAGELFDLIVTKEIMWYVCHNVKPFMKNVVSMMQDDGFLYISQSFPEAKKWYGQDIISSPLALKDIISKYVTPVHYCVEWDYNVKGRPLAHILAKKKSNKNAGKKDTLPLS